MFFIHNTGNYIQGLTNNINIINDIYRVEGKVEGKVEGHCYIHFLKTY